VSAEVTKVAVIGAGVFGRNHARVYYHLQEAGEPVALAAVVDCLPDRAKSLAQAYSGARAFPSVQEMIAVGDIQAASIAVPTVKHLEVARELMEAGIDVLIEKPLAPSLKEADELLSIARRTGRIAQVGHLERFNPAVRATVPLLNHPMFFEGHRLSVFTPRSLDVDVVLDLMIHDLDVVLSFTDSPVKEVRAVGLPILSDKVDIANVRVEFESGCVANFTASRVSTERVRKLRFFQPRQYISIDYTRQDVLVFTIAESAKAVSVLGMEYPDQVSGLQSSAIQMTKHTVTPDEPLRAELRSFLHACRQRTQPEVTLEDGRRVLAMALDIAATIAEHTGKLGLNAFEHSRR